MRRAGGDGSVAYCSPQPREAFFPKSQTVLLPSWETCTQCTALLHIRNGDGGELGRVQNVQNEVML